ncbi:MAG: WbqC family protein [Bacteroidales bacterium]|nr:WbqC family protein [Bacteroidales bacterium]
MKTTKFILLSSTYLGPVEYFVWLIQHNKAYIDKEEHYIKQTYRNRCLIYGANGMQSLSLPVIKVNGNHTKVKDIKISNSVQWQKTHWRSIVSAYNHSPFFLYYRDELEPFYTKTFKYLLDYNQKLLEMLFYLLDINIKIIYTEKFIEKDNYRFIDLRNRFSPKKENPDIVFPAYTQVFEVNHGFIPNLSIIDLLFNEGPNTVEYLKRMDINPD